MPNLTPVQSQGLTLIFVVAITTLVIGYDLLVIRAWGVDSSISHVVRRLFVACPSLWAAFVFWLGVLVGHIFLPAE